ncbi:MAG: hypothetical protein EBX39_11550, partial [Actinobacteria bacterium]|nr:hypothetical protein [Actinomycetota bacterium]
ALSPPWVPTCASEPATIVSDESLILGTPGDDVILATGATATTIRGGVGDDIICGTPAPDRIFGGLGDDEISAGSGADVIDGGSGADTIRGNLGGDTISGGSGDDWLIGGIGDDTMAGNTGDDVVAGGGGVDSVRGGFGGDSIDGGTAPDTIDPGAGDDFCRRDPADTMMSDCGVDRAGPSITEVSVPSAVLAGSTLTVTWRVADPNGVAQSMLTLGGAPGWISDWCGFPIAASLAEGTVTDGIHRVDCTVPARVANGTYTVFLSASDSFGNASGYPSTPTQFDFEVIGGSDDSEPPLITDISTEVGADGEIQLRYRATDQSGVTSVWAYFCLIGSGFASSSGLYLEPVSQERIAGDEFDGVYLQTFRTTAFTPSGTYWAWIGSRDLSGNREFSTYPTELTL